MAVLYNVMLSDTGDNKTTYYSSNTKTTVVTNSAVRAGSESIEVRENSNFYLAVSYANSYKSVELPVCPDEISDSTTANFPLQSVIGSSSPFAAYVGTGAREISFSMTLHREMPGNIENVLELLRASVYPKYTNSAVIPPVTRFVFGKFGVKGVVTNVNFTWKKPLIQKNR